MLRRQLPSSSEKICHGTTVVGFVACPDLCAALCTTNGPGRGPAAEGGESSSWRGRPQTKEGQASFECGGGYRRQGDRKEFGDQFIEVFGNFKSDVIVTSMLRSLNNQKKLNAD